MLNEHIEEECHYCYSLLLWGLIKVIHRYCSMFCYVIETGIKYLPMDMITNGNFCKGHHLYGEKGQSKKVIDYPFHPSNSKDAKVIILQILENV